MPRSTRSTFVASSIATLACGLLFAVAAHADVYKYKDDKGNVLYTDKPMFLPAERLSIKTETSNIVDLDRSNDAPATQTESDAARKPAATKKKGKDDSGGKDDLCKQARQDYLTRMNAQLYEEQPNGEKRKMSQKEIEAARTSAKQAMDSMCN